MTRPATYFEKHFAQIMVVHYQQRVQELPNITLLKKCLKYYQNILLTNSIPTYESNSSN